MKRVYYTIIGMKSQYRIITYLDFINIKVFYYLVRIGYHIHIHSSAKPLKQYNVYRKIMPIQNMCLFYILTHVNALIISLWSLEP